MTEKSTRVDGLQIRYLEEGDGPPILLLHGASLGSSADVFDRNLGPLARGGLRAIAMDRPGYGLSDGPVDASAAAHRRFVLGFLDALDIRSAVVVGHSQQGSVAANLALDQGDRVPRAVILGSGGLLPPLPGGGDERPGEGERFEQEPTLEQTSAQLRSNLNNHRLITAEAVEVRNRMSRGRAFEYYRQRSSGAPAAPRDGGAPAGEPLWRRIGANADRFLLLFGRQDAPSTAPRAELMQQAFPNVRCLLLDGCAHLVQWDQQEVFERETIAFARAAVPA